MLTKLRIKNFKQFDDVEIELGPITVFVGPNNSGKTTALQALALWYAGYLEWGDRIDRQIDPRLGVLDILGTPYYREIDDHQTINRYDLTSIPVSKARLLWRNLKTSNGDTVPIEISVVGIAEQSEWACGIRFTFANEESLTVESDFAEIYLGGVEKILFLPSMSGIASVEPLIQPGRLNVLLGEGRTAETLRNLCYQLYEAREENDQWGKLGEYIRTLFHVDLLPPQYISERGEIQMSYRSREGVILDLPSTGRGMLQIILLLAYLLKNPGAVLLLDEPDAHLEILRQREMYVLLAEVATELGSQIIVATHSEVILETSFQRKDTIIAFVGKPHPIRKYGEFVKSLSLIPAEDYYLADQQGWVLYTEGSTDYDILRAFAERIHHDAQQSLGLTFHKDIGGNTIEQARQHFNGLCEAQPNLLGIGVFDQINEASLLQRTPPALRMIAWQRREVENYLMQPETLVAYARASTPDEAEAQRREQVMREVSESYVPPVAWRDRSNAWWLNTKASDDYLDPVFHAYSERLGQPLQLRKADYHILVQYIPQDQFDPEITEKLDAIFEIARRAKLREE